MTASSHNHSWCAHEVFVESRHHKQVGVMFVFAVQCLNWLLRSEDAFCGVLMTGFGGFYCCFDFSIGLCI
jgi:hypothetical protein